MVLVGETATPSTQAAGSPHIEKLLMHSRQFNCGIELKIIHNLFMLLYYRVSNLEILASAFPNLARGKRSD